jgi:Sec-independent protein translocase protein TatA
MWSLVALVVIVIILVVIARFFPEALSFIARWIGKMVGKHMAKSGVEKVVAEAKTQEDRLKQSADEAEALTKGLQGK